MGKKVRNGTRRRNGRESYSLEDLGAMRPSFSLLRRAGGPSGPLFQNLLVFLMEARKWGKSEEHGTEHGKEESYSYRRGLLLIIHLKLLK